MPVLDEDLTLWVGVAGAILSLGLRVVLRRSDIRGDLMASASLWLLFLAAKLASGWLDAVLPEAWHPLVGVARLLLFAFAAVRLVVAVGLSLRGLIKGSPVPRIQHDVIIFLLYAMVTLPILKLKLQLDFSTVLGTSAVVSLVLGFALQETLGNLFAGISLQLEQPFGVGDFVRIGEFEGRVVQLAWRSTRLETLRREIVTVPNTMVAKQAVISFSQLPSVALDLELSTMAAAPPTVVKEAILLSVQESPLVLAEPAPFIGLQHQDGGNRYLVRLFVRSYRDMLPARDDVMSRLWYRLRRAGVGIPSPAFLAPGNLAGAPRAATTEKVLHGLELFSPFPPEELASIAAAGTERTFGAGERIVTEGEQGASFFVVLEGRVSVQVGSPPAEVAQLPAGEAFGEMVLLTGEPRAASVVALTDTVLLELSRQAFATHFAAHPERVAQLAQLLEDRKVGLKEASERAAAALRGGVLERLKRVFGL